MADNAGVEPMGSGEPIGSREPVGSREPIGSLKMVRVDRIVPSRHQVRKDFNEEGLKGLAESIKRIRLKTPVAVRKIQTPTPLPEGADPNEEWWELFDGERRWRAAKMAGLEYIPAIEYDVKTEQEGVEQGAGCNTQKQELNPIEEADLYALLNKLDPDKNTHEAIAATYGKDRSYVTQSLLIVKMPQFIKDNVIRITLSRSHAVQLLRLPSDDMKVNAAEAIIAKKLSVQAASQLIDKMLGNPGQADKKGKGGKVKGDGVHIAKSGKKVHIEYNGPADTPTDAIARAITEEHQKWQAEQARAEQAKPDPEAEKAAKAAKRAALDEISKLTKALRTAKAHFNSLKAANRDTASALRDIESIKADIQAQKLKLKGSGGPNGKEQDKGKGLDEQATNTIKQTEDFVVKQIKKNMEQAGTGASNNEQGLVNGNGNDGGKKAEEQNAQSGSAQDTKSAQADKVLNDPKGQKNLEEQAKKEGISVEELKARIKKSWGL
jgi:ParB family chromosome partitioning protein